MLSSLFKSFIVLGLYFSILFGVENLFKFFFLRKELADINPDYFLFVPVLMNLLFIILLLLTMKKKKSFEPLKVKLIIRYVYVTFLLAISFFCFKEPFLRIDLILDDIKIPELITKRSRSFIDLIASFLNFVILTPIFEELLFRKKLLSFFSRKNILVGVVSSSFIFSFIHLEFDNINILPLLIFFFFGLISSLLYIRYGFLYNLLFHIISNLIWFLLDLNRDIYWGILRGLNFGFLYWTIVVASTLMFSYLIYIIINGKKGVVSPAGARMSE